MANRRFDGDPPQKLGGFPQQNFQDDKVNPRQEGAAPNNALNSGLLSQLFASQGQLAFALSSLLQTQQPMNNNPQSLVSLPTTPAFNNQDNFGSENPESYNKDNQGHSSNTAWLDISTRPSGSYGEGRHVSSSNRSSPRSNFDGEDRRSPPKGGNDGKPQASGKPDNKAAKSGDKVNESSKKRKEDSSSDDSSSEEDGNETKQKKCDWKQERNTGNQDPGDDEEQNDQDDSVVDLVDLTEDANSTAEDDRKDKEKRPREGIYYDVPASLLHCFVCNKSLSNGQSFHNHIRANAHKQMMNSLGQSFQMTVSILRENIRLVEEKKIIELECIPRNSRNFHRSPQEPLGHCNMCELKWLRKSFSHRRAQGHQRLKSFLYPKCDYCYQNFHSRMEWVDHRFSPDHLRKIKEILDGRTTQQDGAPIDNESPELDSDSLLEENLQTEDDNPVLELTDDFKDLQNRIPAYKPSRELAKRNVQPMSGFYCDICLRFMTSEAAAKEHLRTKKHYNAFVESAKRKYKRQNDEAAAEENAKKRKVEESEEPSKKAKEGVGEGTDANGEGEGDGDEMYDPEEICQDVDDSFEFIILDEEFIEVDSGPLRLSVIKTVAKQEKKEKVVKEEQDKEEKKAAETVSSPRSTLEVKPGGAASREEACTSGLI